MRARPLAFVLALGAGVALGVLTRPTPDAAAVTPAPQRSPDDTAAVTRLLGTVRGAAPLYCELATRMVDGRNYWSSGGGGDAIEMDSASSALIRWVHTRERDGRVIPRLAAALRDPDRCVQRVAAGLLGRMRIAPATSALIAALDETTPAVRAAAAVGLGLSETRVAVQPLLRRLADESTDVRRNAAWALGAIEDRSAMLPLIELLQRDRDPRVRQAAAWALGQVTG